MYKSCQPSHAPVCADPAWLALLTRRWTVPAMVLLGMLMVMPTIDSGLSLDDFLHWAIFHEGSRVAAHPGSPWGLFHFLSGDVAQNQALKARGELMWWASDALRTNFWRPLSEVTHWLDHRLWPRSPALMHLHSVLWYGALILLMAGLHQRLDAASPARARLSVVFFLASSLHLTTVAWIAARNQLVAACFMVACISAFHVWRTRGSRRHGWLAIGLFTLALMSAEAGLATLGYLVAHTLVYGPRSSMPWRQRLRDLWGALLPFLLVAVAWRVAYTAMGYGSAGSAFYIDPAGDPVRFIGLLLIRMPALLLAQLLGVSSATLSLLTPQQQALYAAAAACMIALCWMAARAYGLWHSPLARFLALGAVLALVPMCASTPTDRLLLGAEIGLSGLLAMLLLQVVARHRLHKGWRALSAKLLIGLIMLVHLVIFPAQTVAMASIRKQMMTPGATLDPLSLPDAHQDPDARVVLLNPPVGSLAVYYPAIRRYHGIANPTSIHALAHGLHGLTLSVIDARTLELRSTHTQSFIDDFSRDPVTHPFKIGEVLNVGAFRAVVTALSPQGTPMAVRFQFDSPMHAGPWRFYAWTEAGYMPYGLPAPGQTVALPGPDIGRALMRQLRGEDQHRRHARRQPTMPKAPEV